MALELELPEIGVGIGTDEVRTVTSEYIKSDESFKSVMQESEGLDGPFIAGVVDVGTLTTDSITIYFDFVIDDDVSKVIVSDDSEDANVDDDIIEQVNRIKNQAADDICEEIESRT